MTIVAGVIALAAFGVTLVGGGKVVTAAGNAFPWAFLAAFYRWGTETLWKRLYRRHLQRESVASSPIEIRSFNHDGFFTATAEGAHNLRWPAVNEVVETEKFLLLYAVPSDTYYVPKHAIDVEVEGPLRALLQDVFASRSARLKLLPWAA